MFPLVAAVGSVDAAVTTSQPRVIYADEDLTDKKLCNNELSTIILS